MRTLRLSDAKACFSTVVQMVLQHNAAPEYQGRGMSLFTIAWPTAVLPSVTSTLRNFGSLVISRFLPGKSA